jgi:protein tyrosine phosphatase
VDRVFIIRCCYCCCYSDGVGRSGTYVVVHTGVQTLSQGGDMVSVTDVVTELRRWRKHTVSDRQQLLYCHQAILAHAHNILNRRKFINTLL